VAIHVTEPFSRSKHVKLIDPSTSPGDAIDVLKLNLVRDFQTGIYDCDVRVSLFTSSTEWCGQVYEELNSAGSQLLRGGVGGARIRESRGRRPGGQPVHPPAWPAAACSEAGREAQRTVPAELIPPSSGAPWRGLDDRDGCDGDPGHGDRHIQHPKATHPAPPFRPFLKWCPHRLRRRPQSPRSRAPLGQACAWRGAGADSSVRPYTCPTTAP
jgi:hypothetical protein